MQMTNAIAAVMRRENLDREQAYAVMRTIMTGEASDAQVAAFLMGMAMKGETAEEISGCAQVMRDLMTPVTLSCDNVVDIVGTGGDGANLFNVSTASSFVAAAAGAHVAKHGNRGVSSSSGSADLFQVAGIGLDLDAEQVGRCIEEVGVGFMFAPNHHPAMRHAIGPRREMGVRTLFNILGPLTNPASAPNQLLGVYHADLLELMVEVLRQLGSRHVLVAHAEDGLDEISLAAPTRIAELKDGEIHRYTLTPEDVGIERQSLSPLKVKTAEDSLRLVEKALSGEGPAADIVALNAGAALYAADVADSLKEGVLMAQDAQGTRLALEKMKELAHFTRVFAQ